MDITEELVGQVFVVGLKGRLDGTTSKAVEERILKVIEDGQRTIVFDLQQLDYISSVGLRVLMLAAKRLKMVGGSIVVCALQPNVQQVFDIAGFSALFRTFGTRAQAVQQLQPA
jgi:stage II sporulation protein AA (anti-sigma F factor antagonist)